MGGVSISVRLYVMVLVMLAAVAWVAVGGLSVLRERLEAERQNQCRLLVQGALGHLRQLELQVRGGVIGEAEAKDRAIHAVAAMSDTQGDYLWINDLTPRVIWHPMAEWTGRDVSSWTAPDGRRLFQEFVDRTRNGRGAFVAYDWAKPEGGRITPKLSYVERFQPWGWVIGSGVYMDDVDAAWMQSARHWAGQAGLAVFVGVVVVWLLGRSITRPLAAVTKSIRLLAQGQDTDIPETDRRDEIGEMTRATAVFRRHLLQREEARRAHERTMAQAKTVFDHISEAVMVTDAANRIVLVNPSFTRITGYLPDEVLGRSPSILASGKHDPQFYRAMWDELSKTGEWHGEVWNRTKSGAVYPESLSITMLRAPDGGLDGYAATFMDITDRKRREAQVRWRADHDPLTGLVNRAQFEARLADSLRVAAAENNAAALLYLDLDGFKPINDRLGHAAGDLVLRAAARRIEAAVRGDDVVARLGGDEFAVIITGLTECDEAARIAEKLAATLAGPIEIDRNRVQVGASIGIAVFPKDGETPETLLAEADAAMYAAKRQGRGGYAFAASVLPVPAHN